MEGEVAGADERECVATDVQSIWDASDGGEDGDHKDSG